MPTQPWQRRQRRVGTGPGTFKPWMFWVGLGVVILIFLPTLITNINNTVKNPQSILTGQTTTTTTAQGQLVTVNKPVAFTCYDPLGGSNCGAVTFTIYQGATQLESGTASSGAYTSGTYQTGTKLNVKISGNSYTTAFIPVTIPAMDPNSAISNSNNPVKIYDIVLGSFKLSNAGSSATTGATTFTSGATVFLSQWSGNSVTITTTISETAANKGYISTFDPINVQNQFGVTEISTGGSSLSVQGLPRVYLVGTTYYWQVIHPDGISGQAFSSGTSTATPTVVTSSATLFANGGLTVASADSITSGALSQYTQGNVVNGGSSSFSFIVKVGSLSGSSTQTLTFKFFDYYDPSSSVFGVLTNGGPNAADLLSSDFTIVFHA